MNVRFDVLYLCIRGTGTFMDLEKVYDIVDRDTMWQVIRIYGIGGRVIKGIMSFYDEGRACVRVEKVKCEFCG